MGFNISGLVIDKNYKNDINKLGEILSENLVFEKEVFFEEGSENWKEDGYCDVYFTDNGTLIFIAMERAGFDFKVQSQKAFSFVLSEMSMTFAVNYTDNGKMIRSFAETEDGVKHQEVGDKLPFENEENDASELIYHLIESTLGKSFWDIDVEEKCYRYKFGQPQVETIKSLVKETKPVEVEIKEKKPWWKFW